MIYHKPGQFAGWPANHGLWAWGDEILVGFSVGTYKDLGPDFFDKLKPEQYRRYLVKRLEALGFIVELTPKETAA